MPPLNNNSRSEEEKDPSLSSFSDEREDFQDTDSVAPPSKETKKTGRKEQRGADEVEPSSRSSASSSSSAVAAKTARAGKSSLSPSPPPETGDSKIWVPPALLPIAGVPRLDLPIQAPVRSKSNPKSKGEGEDDVFERFSAGLDALEAAVDAAAAVETSAGGDKKRKKRKAPLFSSPPSSAPSSRHLVDALAEAGAIPAAAKDRVKVLPSLPQVLEASRGVGLPATAADFERWLDDGEEAERRFLRERKKADLGADDAAAAVLPRHAAREAARRWLREAHGAALGKAKERAAAAAQEEGEEGEEGDGEGGLLSLRGPLSQGVELVPGLGSAKQLDPRSGGGGNGDDDDNDSDSDNYGFDNGDGGGGTRRRGLGRRLAGAVGGIVSAPLRLVLRRGKRGNVNILNLDEEIAAADRKILEAEAKAKQKLEIELDDKDAAPPLPPPPPPRPSDTPPRVSQMTREQRQAMGAARVALLIGREKAEETAAEDARAAAAWRAKQRKLLALKTRSYAQRAADETAKITEERTLGAPPQSLSDEEEAAGRAELPQDIFSKQPTTTTDVREPAAAAGRRLDRTSKKARPSGVKPAMPPSVLQREFAGRISLSLFARGIFGVPEGGEDDEGWGRGDFFEGTAAARNPLVKFLPPQLRPSPPLVGFGVYARPGSVAKFLGRENAVRDGEPRSPVGDSASDSGADGDETRPTKLSRWASVRPLEAVRDPLFYADLMRVAPEIGLTVVAWVPRPLPAAALARALGEAAAANAAAGAAAAFRDDLALRRRALASGALPPLPSPADVVDYSEGNEAGLLLGGGGGGDGEGGGGGGGAPLHLGPSWPCLRAGKLAERAAKGAAHQLAGAAEAAARATAAHEAALAEVAELRRRRAAARAAASGPGDLFSERFWRRLKMSWKVRADGRANKIGSSEMGSALPRPALPDSAYAVDRGVFEGALPEKQREKEEKALATKKKQVARSGGEEGGGEEGEEGGGFELGDGAEDEDLIVIPEGEPWIDAQGNIRPGSKLIFSAVPGGGLVVEALPPSRGFMEDAQAARLNGGVPPPPPPRSKSPFSPLVGAWRRFGGVPVDRLEDSSLPQPDTDAARRARLVACCGPGSAEALLGALLGPKPVDKLARARVGQRAAFELHTPEAEAEAEAAFSGSASSSSSSFFDPTRHNLSMTWLASLDAEGMRESMPAMVDSIDAATAPFTLPLLEPATRFGNQGEEDEISASSYRHGRRVAPPTLLRGVSAAAAFARRRASLRQEEEEEEEEDAAAASSWGEDDDDSDEQVMN